MALTSISAREFQSALLEISTDITWKDTYRAQEGEDSAYYFLIDKYLAAARLLLGKYSSTTLNVYLDYDKTKFDNFITSSSNNGTMTKEEAAAFRTMYNYVEHNDYYRMLNGLPAMGALDEYLVYPDGFYDPLTSNHYEKITRVTALEDVQTYSSYVTPYPTDTVFKEGETYDILAEANNRYRISIVNPNRPIDEFWIDKSDTALTIFQVNSQKRIPVHKWSSVDILRWETTDDFTNFIAEHSSDGYQYLQHMTTKKIRPYMARLADRFALLYCPTSDPENLANDFKDAYEKARLMTISVFYTEGLRQREGRYYESFVAMSILFMALNYMNYKYLDVDIDRDFYDLDSLKLIYEAYGVPFYEDIPLTYHKRIVKNINRLIKYKGSNKVFVELCDLFDYDILGIYQYYLLKERKFDTNGNPITVYKQKEDVAGNLQYETYKQFKALYDLKTYPNSRTGVPSKFIAQAGRTYEILDETDTRYAIRGTGSAIYWVAKNDQVMTVSDATHVKLFISNAVDTYNSYEDMNTPGAEVSHWRLPAGTTWEINEYPPTGVDRTGYKESWVCITRESTNPMYDGKIYYVKLNASAYMDDYEYLNDANGYRIPIMVEDSEAMYDVSFLKSNIEENPYNNMSDKDNYLGYHEVVDIDDYWFDDTDTRNTMYNNDYNYIETKYIGVQLTFDLCELVYESCYFMGMLRDNKDSTYPLMIAHDRMGMDVPLWDFVLYVFAAICKKNGYPGVIPHEPSKVARIYGYNYKGIFQVLKETSLQGLQIKKDFYDEETGQFVGQFNKFNIAIGNTEYHGDTIQDWASLEKHLQETQEGKELYTEFIQSMDKLVISDMASIDVAYCTMKDVMEKINYFLTTSANRLEYQAWAQLFHIVYSTELIDDVFRKSDGTIADSFMDLLEDSNPLMWSRLENNDSETDLNFEINYCLVQLENLCSELKYMEFIDGADIDIITEYLYKMLRYFKSAKVDLVDFDLVFRITNRTENMLKLLADLDDIVHKTYIDDPHLTVVDVVWKQLLKNHIYDRDFVFYFTDYITQEMHLERLPHDHFETTESIEDQIEGMLQAEIERVTHESSMYEQLPYKDDIEIYKESTTGKGVIETMNFTDALILLESHTEEEETP